VILGWKAGEREGLERVTAIKSAVADGLEVDLPDGTGHDGAPVNSTGKVHGLDVLSIEVDDHYVRAHPPGPAVDALFGEHFVVADTTRAILLIVVSPLEPDVVNAELVTPRLGIEPHAFSVARINRQPATRRWRRWGRRRRGRWLLTSRGGGEEQAEGRGE
jgi:hypothetical protein